MSDTYTQLYIQYVFDEKERNSFIQDTWEEVVYKYMTVVAQNDQHKNRSINGMRNHIPVFLGLNLTFSI